MCLWLLRVVFFFFVYRLCVCVLSNLGRLRVCRRFFVFHTFDGSLTSVYRVVQGFLVFWGSPEP